MVTKKQRRSRLAREGRLRRETRRAQRETRRRRVQVAAATLTAIAAVVALVAWIVLHDADATAGTFAPDDYDAWSVALASDAEPETRRGIP